MIEKTISEIETKISGADAVNAAQKAELLQLLGTLKTEVAMLAKTHSEQADSIAGFAKMSAHEATRTEQNPRLRELSDKGFRSSVDGFEKSHPKLVQVVSSISKTLSELGS